MKTEKTQKLVDLYHEFSQGFDNDFLKSSLKDEILKIYSEINNPNAEDNYTLGLTYYEYYDKNTSKDLLNKRTYKAISFFKKSIQYNPEYYMSNYYLGHCYQDFGEYEKAIEYYLKVSQDNLKKEFPLWRFVLLFELIAFCYWKIGDNKNAMKYFEKTSLEYLKLKDYLDLIPIGYLMEFCLADTHSLVVKMKEYAEIKSNE